MKKEGKCSNNIKPVRNALGELDGKIVWLVTSITQYNFISELVTCKHQSTDSIYFCSITDGTHKWAFYDTDGDNYLPMQTYCFGEMKELQYQKRKFFTDGSIVAELSYFTLKYTGNISIDDMEIFKDGWIDLNLSPKSNVSILLGETEKKYFLRDYIDSCISKDFILSIQPQQKLESFAFDHNNKRGYTFLDSDIYGDPIRGVIINIHPFCTNNYRNGFEFVEVEYQYTSKKCGYVKYLYPVDQLFLGEEKEISTVGYWKKFFMDTFLFLHSTPSEINMDWSTEFPPINHLSLCFMKDTFCGIGLAYISSKGDNYITIKVGYPGNVFSYDNILRGNIHFAKGVLTTKVF